AEFFAGIPGTVGGALTMNAGAFGGETWNQVESVEVINRQGEVTVRYPDEYQVAYREVSLIEPREEWFIGGTFRFTENYDTSPEKVKALVNQRKESQPLGLPSCGSVFRNPPGDHAARLIEAAGLKGHVIGGAVVSDKHANFIINTGTATAADIENLIKHVQATVKREFDVELVREVHIIGEAA
ncbi:MAG: UDP-N-acetylmuramate dehydrogenase, partial [Gammaproteobacteria bacterium]|nr:UDP-N-acetylmuramate dehydrogenase [Gammaproteobacteria bacterium]